MTRLAPGLEALDVVALDTLRPAERNPRRGDVDAIRASLLEHGQYRPLVVNRRTGQVLAGNHTMRAMLELGWESAAVTWVDVDPDQASRIVLADNRTNETSTYDLELLERALSDLGDLTGSGWTADDLDLIRADLVAPDGFSPPDDPGPKGDGGGHPDDGEPAAPHVCPGCGHRFHADPA